MRRASSSSGGFSLIEVIITIGVFTFAFVGLLGMFPLALEQSRNCVDETRSAQLARMVFATLVSEDFNEAQCFGTDADAKLDLATLDDTSLPTVLFASYDVRSQAHIVRVTGPTPIAPPTAEYRLELRFQPATATTGGSSRGTLARLQIVGEPKHKAVAFESTQFLCKSARAVFSK